jgi:ABC-type spermidine/putrescine transport system permease subunit I
MVLSCLVIWLVVSFLTVGLWFVTYGKDQDKYHNDLEHTHIIIKAIFMMMLLPSIIIALIVLVVLITIGVKIDD